LLGPLGVAGVLGEVAAVVLGAAASAPVVSCVC
jgi:hypothetical protein